MSATVKDVITIVENETIMAKWGAYLTMFYMFPLYRIAFWSVP